MSKFEESSKRICIVAVIILLVCIENYKDIVMDEEFRQLLLYRTSAEAVNLDESKRPTFTPVNESFRRLAVD